MRRLFCRQEGAPISDQHILDALTRFREAALANLEAQDCLAAMANAPDFAEAAAAWSQAQGIPLCADDFEVLASFPRSRLPKTQLRPDCPPCQWLPAAIDAEAGTMEWAHFGGAPLDDPFYYDSVRKARLLPFNRLVPWRTPLSALAQDQQAAKPAGLIFHMSRCGSTLAGRVLSAVPRHVVISEAPPLDAIVQHAARHGTMADPAVAKTLRNTAAALARDRTGDTRFAFYKLDAWHASAIPLYRAAFPDVPWIFLFRDPLEVIVSQMRMRGSHTVPGQVEAALVGGPFQDGSAGTAYVAHVLSAICAGAIEAAPLGGGLFVDYRELPTALFTRILPHFGLALSPADRALMAAALAVSAKRPDQAFAPDSDEKRRGADPEARTAAANLHDVYSALGALAGQPSPSTAS